MSSPPSEEHVHVHVEREQVVREEPVPRTQADPKYVVEERTWASFLTAQLLWVLLIALLVVALIALLASGVIDFGGADAIDPTAVP
jgi:hypothetical protein